MSSIKYSVVDVDTVNSIRRNRIRELPTVVDYNMIKITPNLETWALANHEVAKPYIALLKGEHEAVDNPYSRSYVTSKGTIVGLLTNEFTYSLTSEWDKMDYPQILNLNTFKDLAAFGGGGEMGAVFKSKKVWKRSGDITINPEIRVFDTDGYGYPMKVVKRLLMLSSAVGEQYLVDKDVIVTAMDTIHDLGVKAQEGADNATASITEHGASDGFRGFIDTTSATVTRAMSAAIGGGRKAMEDLDDFAKLRISPPPVTVECNGVFYHPDMVITKVEFTFSKQVTETGPLYVDIKLDLVTRKIISNINECGIVGAKLEKNVVVDIPEQPPVEPSIGASRADRMRQQREAAQIPYATADNIGGYNGPRR